MEDNGKKRTRDELEDEEVDSPESRLTRVASDADSADSKRLRSDSGEETEAKKIQEDLLDILDDSDDRDPAIQGLESVMKSFEEEILVPAGTVEGKGYESQPDLGFLLEASDDELGLPPSSSSGEEQKAEALDLDFAAGGFGGILEFEDQLPYYDSFEFGIVGDSANNANYNDSVDFMALGGLFDYSDGSCQPADVSEIPWRTAESLSSL
ncbi:hypothetical protein HS088_TW20G00731 [Tripterygium wilfordii]|uniref:Uncharacterized protein n=1 Tax=Tripterygium wilfordii TaxID=458696 RepID=A0A7J7C884_TRIWF|nr:uncharacterized protein LOC119986439 [Tripterygium wilfordii]KAF5730358.1 hypothetical protein HS088_TW20G00731 [Tripterygium wilfordii]